MATQRCIEHESNVVWDYIGMIIGIICILINLFIFIKSVKEIPTLKKFKKAIKIQYFMNCIFSMLCMIFGILYQAVNCTIWIDSVVILCYWVLVGGILNTLLLRLDHTFKDSAYRLTPCQSWTIHIIFYILIIIAIITLVLYILFSFTDLPIDFIYPAIAAGISTVLYLGLTGYALYLFAHKLLILVDSRTASMRNIADENAIKLSKMQTKLINQTSRIISLISIAMLTTFINAIAFTYLDQGGIINLIWTYIDCAINVICLYLTYPFSTKYYNKFCGCFDKCWNNILSRDAKNKMERKYKDIQKAKSNDTQNNDETEERTEII